MLTTIRLQSDEFDAAAEAAALTHGRTDIGALVTFTGICRGAESGEISRHVEDAKARWPLLGVTVIHRYGRIAPGENIVLVITASSHREAAFAAAEFLMDYLKTQAPFWKQVEATAGKTWVEAKGADDAAAARWNKPPGREAAE
jgi:molybdopterin synthase catalytic subunit